MTHCLGNAVKPHTVLWTPNLQYSKTTVSILADSGPASGHDDPSLTHHTLKFWIPLVAHTAVLVTRIPASGTKLSVSLPLALTADVEIATTRTHRIARLGRMYAPAVLVGNRPREGGRGAARLAEETMTGGAAAETRPPEAWARPLFLWLLRRTGPAAVEIAGRVCVDRRAATQYYVAFRCLTRSWTLPDA
jgi:hypothetical protein